MDTNFVLVTSLIYTDKRPINHLKRSPVEYLYLFKYIQYLNVPTILFCSEKYIKDVPKHDQMIIIPKEIEELKSYKFLIDNNVDISKLKSPVNSGDVDIYYSSIINSKISLMNEAKIYLNDNQLYSNLTHLVWLDAGISHVCSISKKSFIKGINYNMYNDKITLIKSVSTHAKEIVDIDEFLRVNRGKMAAGLSIVPTNMLEWYDIETEKLFHDAVLKYNRSCMEEQLIPILTLLHKENFEFIYAGCKFLLNLRRIKCELFIIIYNLKYCQMNDLLNDGYKLLIKILKDISHGKYLYNENELFSILYYGQIITYYEDKDMCKKLSYLIGYVYHRYVRGKYHEFHSLIDEKFEHIKKNISYVGYDLSNKENFPENLLLSIDDTRILEIIL